MVESKLQNGNPEVHDVEMRDVFGQTLVELGAEHGNMIVLDADLHTSSKAGYFKSAYPDRFIQIGIAEQNLFGVAAGLALTGFIPFPSTFAVFATRRALDQIAISICYPKLNVKIPGSYVGLPTSRAGASHNCIEDIAVMRALPNMRVADAGDNADLRGIMRAAVDVEGPVYFRVTRYTLPDLFGPDHTFEWGKGNLLRKGEDVTIFGTGLMTGLCMEAAEILAKDGISAEVIHMGSIKPIDRDLIVQSVRKSGGIDELFTHHGMQPTDIAGAAKVAIQHKGQTSRKDNKSERIDD
jgi:transketolase